MDGILNPSTYSPGILDQSQMNPVMQQGNNQARSQALNSGLMAAGAGLLGANNLSEGLSQGLSGFNRAYDTSLVANRPKVIPLADGSFSQISFPDGTVQIVRNPDVEQAILKRDTAKKAKVTPMAGGAFSQITKEDGTTEIVPNAAVADYLMQLEEKKGVTGLTKQIVGATAGVGSKADQANMALGQKAQEQLSGIDSSIGNFQRALDATKDRGLWAQAQATPLLKGIADFFGSPDAIGTKMLDELKVDSALRMTAQTKGAISDSEMKLFLLPAPAATADMETVWKPWIQNKISVMERLKPVFREQVKIGQEAALGSGTRAAIQSSINAVAPQSPLAKGTGGARMTGAIPGVSPETSDWLSKNGY